MLIFLKRRLFVYAFISLALIFVSAQTSLSQTNAIPDTKGDRESFMQLSDGVIKREIVSFNITGSLDSETSGFAKTQMTEIPLRNCTDSSTTFQKGDIIATDILVSISSTGFDTAGHKLTYADSSHQFLLLIDDKPIWGTDGGVPKEKIASVRFIHVKYQLILPHSAIAGLYEPNFCYNQKAREKPAETFCKVFQSADKRRVYIYMLNGDGAGGYEVTWIIEDSKYLKRVVD
ncbi:hypothetical protein BH10BAC2_BH10BAC2_14740 [soil metagenome]